MAQKTQTIDGVTSTGTPSDLDHLDALAAQVDGEHLEVTADGVALADVPAPTNYGQEAAATVDTFAALLVGYCPAAADLWTDDKKAAVSAALAPVMEKYGFTLGALPVELVLIITAGPLLYQSSKLVAAQMKREQDAAKQATMARTVTAATGQDKPAAPEAPEVARHPQTALYQ
jgi:hypothetical protein